MAEKDRALILYGFTIDQTNRYINFKNVSLGPELTAVLNLGNYTGTEFAAEIKRAMEFADGNVNTYSVIIDRTVTAGLSNRLHISTSGAFLSILFSSGTNALASPRSLMGWDILDYVGLTSYAGSTNCGIILYPDFPIWNYQGPDDIKESDGSKNVTANGIKETLVYAQVSYFKGEWRFITNYNGNSQKTQWVNFLSYAIKQLKLEFTPSVYESTSVFYECTVETTPADGQGMKYELQLMVSQGLYRFYQTGNLKFRLIPVVS